MTSTAGDYAESPLAGSPAPQHTDRVIARPSPGLEPRPEPNAGVCWSSLPEPTGQAEGEKSNGERWPELLSPHGPPKECHYGDHYHWDEQQRERLHRRPGLLRPAATCTRIPSSRSAVIC